MTFSGSGLTVTVNGSAVTSPYTLQNGDTIVLKSSNSNPAYVTYGDKTIYTDTVSSPISISDSDINVVIDTDNISPSLASGFTINYTE